MSELSWRALTKGELLSVIGAAAASVALLFFATGSSAMALAFAMGLAVFGLAAFVAMRRLGAAAPAGEAALPDWSVTATAIEQADPANGLAIAITDRANRLVCANSAYERAFGSAHAPPRLALPRGAESAAEGLMRGARAAWRDGACEPVTIETEGTSWSAVAHRAGTGQDYLVWRFIPRFGSDRLDPLAKLITGPFGAMLSAAGIEAALVDAEWTIQAVNPGFARRACDDDKATLAGHEFLALLRSDERERIFFAREGAEGSAQALVTIPLVEPGAGRSAGHSAGNEAGHDADHFAGHDAPALMLLLDSQTCLPGWTGEPQGQAEQLDGLLAGLPLGLAVTDRNGRFLFANEAFYRAARIEGEDLPPYPSDLVVRADKGVMSDAVHRYRQSIAGSGDISVRLRNDPEEPVSFGLARVRGLGEAAVLLSLADTTEEARLKRQIAQATKMQAVGQLAGGVAHDFNNVLTAIIGHCDLMLLRHLPGDSDYDDIQQIRINSNRAAALTGQLLAFSRQQTLQPAVIQLPDVLAEMGHMLRRLLGARVTLETSHDRDLAPVRADPRQIEQVIMNLAVNARDAIQARQGDQAHGRLTFTTRRVTAADVKDPGSEIMPAGDYVGLIAEDTGGGIAPEIVGKIFEPFFTTKDPGRGTGLGLSTVYGIVKQSGGFIFADNVVHGDGARGARFSVYLPVHHSSAKTRKELSTARAPEAEPARDWASGGRILLVEDEDMVRVVAERALAREGYSVTAVADGEEGLEQVRAGGEFDLIVSDVVMPGMDGPAMARAIRELVPGIPVLFMSGYAESQLRRDIDMKDVNFIAKPFSVAEIAARAGAVLWNRGS